MLQDGDLRLRPLLVPDDVELAMPWYADAEVLRLSEGEGTPPYDYQTVEAMYKWMTSNGEAYIIEVETAGAWAPIGDVLLAKDGLPIVIGNAQYRGKGIGKRVIALLIARAKALGWTKLKVGKVFTYNLRSRCLFERLGFALSGQGIDDAGRAYWTFELSLVT